MKTKEQLQPITIALAKGKLLDHAVEYFDKLGLIPEDVKDAGRKLIFNSPKHGLTYLIVRPTDVPTYVEYGAADIGIVGKDMLLEQEKDLYELFDLKFGHCKIVVAGPKEAVEPYKNGNLVKIRVATKYPRITELYFASRGVHADIKKLYGFKESAPLGGFLQWLVM